MKLIMMFFTRAILFRIEVDEGVSASNAAALAEAGAEIFVAGSAVFKAEVPAAVISAMRG